MYVLYFVLHIEHTHTLLLKRSNQNKRREDRYHFVHSIIQLHTMRFYASPLFFKIGKDSLRITELHRQGKFVAFPIFRRYQFSCTIFIHKNCFLYLHWLTHITHAIILTMRKHFIIGTC